jgi:uncharacterized protein HemX
MKKLALQVLTGALILGTCGCHSHQSDIDAAQRDYDQAAQQFRTDCTAETLRMPAQLSTKCADEQKRMNDAYGRLQSQQQKK